MIELQNLAVAIRDTNALDADGIVAAQMAQDLADTNPRIMVKAFALARRRHKWLPKTPEVFDLYEEVLREEIKADDARRQQDQRRSEEAALEDRRLHPEKYITLGQVLLETPGFDEHTFSLQRRADLQKNVQAARDNAPTVEQCPYCERPIPMRVADLRELGIDHLQAMIDAKQRRIDEARTFAEAEAAKLTPPPAAAKPARKRRKKGTA